MQNDVLKNTIAPWQEKGRWYHGVWDYSTNNFDPDKTDPLLLDTSIFQIASDGGSNYTFYPLPAISEKYTVVDVKYKALDNIVASANVNTYIGAIRTTTAGATGRIIARSGSVTEGHADIWIFIDRLEP